MASDLIDGAIEALAGALDPHGPPLNTANSFTPGDFSVHFFLQLAIIIFTCRLVGRLGQKFLAQPQVVGEMIAGVILGPSLFGLLAPEIQAAIFPGPTKNVLYAGAQLGVGLYMFLVGTTLQLDHFKAKARSAASVSLAGVVTPFLIAIVITPYLLKTPGLFAEEVIARLLTLGPIQKDVIDRIELALRTEFMAALSRGEDRDPYAAIAEIFNKFDRATERRFMEALTMKNPDAADRIRAMMFVFEDLAGLDPADMQTLLRFVDKSDLALALNAKGNRDGAIDQLIEIVKRDRKWNDDGARKQLVQLFDAWGPTDDATVNGRKRLSSVLFA